MKKGRTAMKDPVRKFAATRDNLITEFELGAMDSDIRGRALALYGLEIAGAQEDSDVCALGGNHPEDVCKELEKLRKGKSDRVKVLIGKWQRAQQKYRSHLQATRHIAGDLSDGYQTAFTKWGEALVRECDTLTKFLDAAEYAGWMDVGEKVEENGKAKPPARSKKGKAGRKKREAWTEAKKDAARAFRRALPSMLPDDSPVKNGRLDARGVVGGWTKIALCFERWAAKNPALARGFPPGAAAVISDLKSLFRALKDSGE